VFVKALVGQAFAVDGVVHKSFQDKVKLDDGGARVPTAAFTVNGAAKVFPTALLSLRFGLQSDLLQIEPPRVWHRTVRKIRFDPSPSGGALERLET
jgi:hypothetical protein